MFRFLALLSLTGCELFSLGGQPDDTANPADDTGTQDDTDTGEGIHPDAPVISEITSIDCYDNVDAEPTWIVEARVTDPQGDDNISVMGGHAVIVVGGIDGTHRPAVFAAGLLSTSWTSTAEEEPCTIVAKMRVVAVDDEGHESEGAEVDLPFE